MVFLRRTDFYLVLSSWTKFNDSYVGFNWFYWVLLGFNQLSLVWWAALVLSRLSIGLDEFY